jgi:hypothetical protein
VFGTPGYLPPEALRGQATGPPGDLFALGLGLGRLSLSDGSGPFEGGTPAETLTNTLKGRVPPHKTDSLNGESLIAVCRSTLGEGCQACRSLVASHPRG